MEKKESLFSFENIILVSIILIFVILIYQQIQILELRNELAHVESHFH